MSIYKACVRQLKWCVKPGASQSGGHGAAHAAAPITTWGGPVKVHRAEPAPRSRFVQQLELEPKQATEEPGASEQEDAAYAALLEAARCVSLFIHRCIQQLMNTLVLAALAGLRL